ncbi:hypothetical protein SAMN02745664_12340 [Moraxella cuniculi DSM 21768]|uniref:Uncharacterized protein n=1 Tax=Moraxella cuniculi DSM 21768 TaxID=1122245 RepID=A0A1N7G5J3_9GAMM|nr:hypothetical protein [Moraxella cuniculi]SIS07696.1 hypothetical protein SAMN02745664_12340 [Moraxella cuniculi DSM 21768]
MQESIHPIQRILGLLGMVLMMKGCLYAFDREMEIQEELGRQYYQESIRPQQGELNP